MLSEFGELCLSPVGISAVTRLAPVRIVGLMMGVWFLSNAFGNKLAGWAAGFFSTTPLVTSVRYRHGDSDVHRARHVRRWSNRCDVSWVRAGHPQRNSGRAPGPNGRIFTFNGTRQVSRETRFHDLAEPAGDTKRKSPAGRKPRFFCVQKHLASHLALRLQAANTNGVLLSWAVPKGRPWNPSVKRLAMHVEDHPVEYGEFEGVIPEGYGAGIVMLWDRGTWIPESDDVDAALKKGDLKFTLDGYKLKGSWVLVRTRARIAPAGAASWPFVAADQSTRTIGLAPSISRSSHRSASRAKATFADILSQDNPDIWHSNRPAKGGDTGALFERIIQQAQALKSGAKAADGRAREARLEEEECRARRRPPLRKRRGPYDETRRSPAVDSHSPSWHSRHAIDRMTPHQRRQRPSGPQWAKVRNDLVEDYLKAHPAFAVVAGRHEYDGVLPDWSAQGIAAEIQAAARRERSRASPFQTRPWTKPSRYERDEFVARVDRDLFWVETAEAPFYQSGVLSRLDARRPRPPRRTVTRTYAPLETRMRAYTKYARSITQAAAQIRANLPQHQLARPLLERGLSAFKGFADFFAKDVPGAFCRT
jgi:DNA ligase D-like protein (predicted 3'-phosphoesterase)